MRSSSFTHRYAIACGVVCLLHVGAAAVFLDVVIDDAYISCRYARNLAEGHGPTFNTGERVEGFSHPLYILLLGLGTFLGATPITFAKIIGLASSPTLLVLLAVTLRRWARDTGDHVSPSRHGGKPSDHATILSDRAVLLAWITLAPALAIDAALVFWSVAGLETTLYTLLVFAGIALTARELHAGPRAIPWSALLLGAAALTRPEGVMFFVVCLFVATVWTHFVRGEPVTSTLRAVLMRAALFGVVVAPYQVFRLVYYGDWLPNTYYAKTGGEVFVVKGVRYCIKALKQPFGLTLIVLAALGSIRLARSRRSALPVLVLLCGLAQAAFVFWSGGDWMPVWRFIVPALPLLALLAMMGMHRVLAPWLSRAGTAMPALLCGAVSVALVFVQVFRLSDAHHEHHWRIARGLDTRLALGRWMVDNLPSDFRIAYGDMGALPYASRAHFIDLNGLTDAVISRIKYEVRKGRITEQQRRALEVAYVLEQRPDMAIVVTRDDPAQGGWEAVTYGTRLVAAPQFQQHYRRVGHLIAYPPDIVPRWPTGRYLVFYLRNDVALPELASVLRRINRTLSSR